VQSRCQVLVFNLITHLTGPRGPGLGNGQAKC
jgi:hypothetical protein